MSKIYCYECRRLLWNKFFGGLIVVLLCYGALVLRGVTILGVSHTAPFSPWSFGDYLSRMLPLLWIGALFFLSFFTSVKARRTASLIDTTPMLPSHFAFVRCAAAFTGTVILALLCIVEAAVFYRQMFGWHDWSSMVFPALVTLLPPLGFVLGSGWLFGRLRHWMLYVWMSIPILLAMIPLPEIMGLWNGSFFTAYPLTLEELDPAFTLPGSIAIVQLLLLVVGVSRSVPVLVSGASSTCWKVTETTTLVQMLMYGREAQSKTKTASPATIPKSGERNRKIHSCMLYLISI